MRWATAGRPLCPMPPSGCGPPAICVLRRERSTRRTWTPLCAFTSRTSPTTRWTPRGAGSCVARRAARRAGGVNPLMHQGVHTPPLAGGWLPGIDNYRVVYSAGYATIPEEVQEACAQWVAHLFWQSKDNPALHPDSPTITVAVLLAPFRRQTAGRV